MYINGTISVILLDWPKGLNGAKTTGVMKRTCNLVHVSLYIEEYSPTHILRPVQHKLFKKGNVTSTVLRSFHGNTNQRFDAFPKLLLT